MTTDQQGRSSDMDRRNFLAATAAAASGLAAPVSAHDQAVTHRSVEVNGIRLHIAEQGQGPLVLLCHGWPELWYSWRQQLQALAAAGYHAVAPDMRGYGDSTAPEEIGAYTLLHLVGDLVGLVAALGESKAVIVGHDWGATVAWTAAQLRPDLFPAVVALSVPFRRRAPAPPLESLRKAGQQNSYLFYFQTPGLAEAELERDIPTTFRRLAAGGSLMIPPGRGLLDGFADPERLPGWLSPEDLAVYVTAYQRSGFRGGLNWYRNMERNWELLAPWQDAAIRQPVLFIAGSEDGAIRLPASAAALAQMPETVPGLKRKVIIDGGGHWIQRQRAAEVNAALLDFLGEFGGAVTKPG
jgi:pimeloyl-ACP methyl ester carboxylesterase